MPLAIDVERAARYQTLQMHVSREGFSPRVEHRCHANLSVEPLPIGTEGPQCLRGAAEQ